MCWDLECQTEPSAESDARGDPNASSLLEFGPVGGIRPRGVCEYKSASTDGGKTYPFCKKGFGFCEGFRGQLLAVGIESREPLVLHASRADLKIKRVS